MAEPVYFYGHHRPNGFMSNFYASPFTLDGIEFPTSEHAFMYHKAVTFNDVIRTQLIRSAPQPTDAKRYGRLVTPFDNARWEAVRYDIMIRVLMAKFEQNDELKTQLLATAGRVLAEASPSDRTWGIGISFDEAKRDVAWRGTNLLGKALMEVRDHMTRQG